MRGTLVVAAREIMDRRVILLAALFAGVLPFASVLLPGVGAGQSADAQRVTAIFLGAVSTIGAAIMLGASVAGRDHLDRRMGFDFARPLSGGAIWAGRFLGVIVLTLGVLAAVLLPTGLVRGGLGTLSFHVSSQPWGLFQPFGLMSLPGLLAAVLLLIPLAHVVTVAFRSRSAWLGLDMAALLGSLLIAVLAGRRLLYGFALNDLTSSITILCILAIPALWVASVVQVTMGRTDIKRGHRVQAIILWSTILGMTLCFDAYSRSVVLASPADLSWPNAGTAPRGHWITATGSARGRGDFIPLFLINASTGRFLRLGGADPRLNEQVVFSSDGRRAVCLRSEGPSNPRHEVLRIDLDRPDQGFRETTITIENLWPSVALSEDGARMALLDGKAFSVYELSTGRLLVSVRVESTAERGPRPLVYFSDQDHVRMIALGAEIEIRELDVSRKKLVRTGSSAFEARGVQYLLRDPARDRLLVRTSLAGGTHYLLDGRSGATMAALTPRMEGASLFGFRFLEDGRLVFLEQAGTKSWIRAVSRDGSERQFDPGTRDRLEAGDEIVPGSLALVAGNRQQYRVLVVEISTGEVRELAQGLGSVQPGWFHPLEPASPGSAGTRLFRTSMGALVDLDPRTGEQRVLTGSARAPGA